MPIFVAIALTVAVVQTLNTSYTRFVKKYLVQEATKRMEDMRAVGYAEGTMRERMRNGSYNPDSAEQIATDMTIEMIEFMEERR